MTLQSPGPSSDLPLQRWRAAVAALAQAERIDPRGLDVDRLANEVIAARVALIQVRIADGWTPTDAARDESASDALLLRQPLGFIAQLLPEQTRRPFDG
jgi:hypothetical protein